MTTITIDTTIDDTLRAALDALVAGDLDGCVGHIESIAEAYFPVDGDRDPMWPAAAHEGFTCAALFLIDRVVAGALEGPVTLTDCQQFYEQLEPNQLRMLLTMLTGPEVFPALGDPVRALLEMAPAEKMMASLQEVVVSAMQEYLPDRGAREQPRSDLLELLTEVGDLM